MPRVKLNSNNASVTVGGVRLSKQNPYADVSAELARRFAITGFVEVICHADDTDKPVDPPFSEEEVKDVNMDELDPGFAASLKSDAAEFAASDTSDEGEVVVDEIVPMTGEMVKSATTKTALLKLASEYDVDLSGCTTNDERRAALMAALEQ